MADDAKAELKATLTKLLQSRGQRTFYYGYAAGKRADGKGDGALEMAAKKKQYKKDDFKEDVESVQAFTFGKCWSDKDGTVVYFQGKGLTEALLEKLYKTAKKLTGKDYDFRLPSPEEEAARDAHEQAEGTEQEGEETAQVPPQGEADLQTRLKSLLVRLKSLLAAAPQLKAKLEPLGPAAAAAVQKGGPAAAAALDALEKALDAIPTAPPHPDQTPLPTPDGHTPAAAKWQVVREAVVTKLRDLAKEVVGIPHPETQKALLEINAVMRQLTPKPESRQQVAELERYLQQDDVVFDVCELAFDLRTPLLKILTELKTQLPA
jgi:hypothetical protein